MVIRACMFLSVREDIEMMLSMSSSQPGTKGLRIFFKYYTSCGTTDILYRAHWTDFLFCILTFSTKVLIKLISIVGYRNL